MHIAKTGLRVLGVAESFSSRERSTLAGVVMRKDLRIDGISFTSTTVGGTDSTQAIIDMYHSLDRDDINAIMVSGAVISWYNIIDPEALHKASGKGVILVTYEDSEGLEEDIRRHFPEDRSRLDQYFRLGRRTPVLLQNGYTLYIRCAGITDDEAGALCAGYTYDGRVPEPLRVARLCARGLMRYSCCLR